MEGKNVKMGAGCSFRRVIGNGGLSEFVFLWRT